MKWGCKTDASTFLRAYGFDSGEGKGVKGEAGVWERNALRFPACLRVPLPGPAQACSSLHLRPP